MCGHIKFDNLVSVLCSVHIILMDSAISLTNSTWLCIVYSVWHYMVYVAYSPWLCILYVFSCCCSVGSIVSGRLSGPSFYMRISNDFCSLNAHSSAVFVCALKGVSLIKAELERGVCAVAAFDDSLEISYLGCFYAVLSMLLYIRIFHSHVYIAYTDGCKKIKTNCFADMSTMRHCYAGLLLSD